MFDRLRRRRDPADVLDEIRRTIVRLDDQRRLAAQAAGQALVSQAEIVRLSNRQLAALAAAFGEAEHAQVVAERAAASARSEGSPDAEGYERTATALHSSQDVLGAAAEPIHALLASGRDNVERARAVLAQARVVLDEQLREQVRALRVVEQAEKARLIARARRSADG